MSWNCQVPIIGLVMGEMGLISRILCAKSSGYLTFGTLESGFVSAPGQPTIKDLLDLYNFRQIGPDTKVFGIIGKPVGHSKSPFLYNEAFKSVGFNGVYVHLLVDDIANFLQTCSSTDFAGFSHLMDPWLKEKGSYAVTGFENHSCTIPHKEAAVKCSDEVDPVAKSIGAVSSRQKDGKGKLFGYNTDYVGAISAIEDGLRERAKELAETIGADAVSLADLDNFHPEYGMILANTTSIGMQPKVDETPISKHALRSYSLVFYAVYTPKITRLLREAEESGATIVSGLEMFIGQAYEQFERFTGLSAPEELFKKIMSKN
ncbi:hypothetical protein BDE02_08G178400 [Populus trichocarpa]|nr:hypothetical protein BDE02_08G178400 [Populus trichocarpa]